MSTGHNMRTNSTRAGAHHPESIARDAQTHAIQPSAMAAADDWVPEDRAPSAAESNFMSIALFGFLILFGLGCFIIF